MTTYYCKGCNNHKQSNEIALSWYVKGGVRVHSSVKGAIEINCCLKCDEQGKLICARCETVHLHEADCKFWLSEVREAVKELCEILPVSTQSNSVKAVA